MATQNRAAHFFLNGKPFMLDRTGQGRAWSRSGAADVPTRRSTEDSQYGNLPDTLDHPEVWDDWSGGFGQRYRDPSNPTMYAWSNNLDARFPRQIIHSQRPQMLPANTAASVAIKFRTNAQYFIDVPLVGVANPPPGAGAVLILGKGYIVAMTPKDIYDAQSSVDAVFDVAIEASFANLNFGRRPAIYGSFVFIPNTDGSAIYRRNISNAAYTIGTATIGNATWFQVAGQQLWYNAAPSRLRQFVSAEGNLLNGTGLGATINVGLGYFDSRDAVALENQLYVGMPDGAYQGSISGTFNNILNSIGPSVDIDNCADMTTFNGGLVAAEGPHLWWFKPSSIQSTLREIGPDGLGIAPMLVASGNNQGISQAVRGKFTSVQANGRWLYAGLFTGSGSVFMAGIDRGDKFAWYPLHDFNSLNVKVTHIHVDHITSSSGGVTIPNRIWAATDASWGAGAAATSPIFYWEIPNNDDNPLLDTTFIPNYTPAGAIDLAISDWGAPATSKIWRTTQVWADTLGSVTGSGGATVTSVFADLNYAIDSGASPAVYTLGRAWTSPRSELFFPSTQGSFATGLVMRMRLSSYSTIAGGADYRGRRPTPVYRAIVNRGLVAPDIADTIEAQVRIADNMVDLKGAKMRPAANQISDLRGYADGSAPVMLTDLVGAPWWVKVMGPVDEHEVWQQGLENPEISARVRMAVMSYSSGQPP